MCATHTSTERLLYLTVRVVSGNAVLVSDRLLHVSGRWGPPSEHRQHGTPQGEVWVMRKCPPASVYSCTAVQYVQPCTTFKGSAVQGGQDQQCLQVLIVNAHRSYYIGIWGNWKGSSMKLSVLHRPTHSLWGPCAVLRKTTLYPEQLGHLVMKYSRCLWVLAACWACTLWMRVQ